MSEHPERVDAYLVAGGRFHDIDYARLQLLNLLAAAYLGPLDRQLSQLVNPANYPNLRPDLERLALEAGAAALHRELRSVHVARRAIVEDEVVREEQAGDPDVEALRPDVRVEDEPRPGQGGRLDHPAPRRFRQRPTAL